MVDERVQLLTGYCCGNGSMMNELGSAVALASLPACWCQTLPWHCFQSPGWRGDASRAVAAAAAAAAANLLLLALLFPVLLSCCTTLSLA